MAEEGQRAVADQEGLKEETLPTAEEEAKKDEAPGQEEHDIMCGACGQILKRNAYKFCVRCGVKLNPESVWDAQLCNSTHDTPNIARVRQEMIGRGVKVVIADGRIFVGRFLAFDKQRSMILSECREYRRVKIDDDGPGIASSFFTGRSLMTWLVF